MHSQSCSSSIVFAAYFAFQIGCISDGPDELSPEAGGVDLESSVSPRWYDLYEIRSHMHHKCLDVFGLDTGNGARVGMWDCWGGANQRWYWYGDEIRSILNNKCLDVLGFNNNNGAAIGMWDCWGGSNQRWYWDGNQIRSRFNHKCIDILGFNPDNGAYVGMWDCWGGSNQQWYSL